MAEKTTQVTLNQDLYPYVFGDVVSLTDEQLKAVDAEAKRRGIEKPYTKGNTKPDREKIVTPTGDSDAELARQRGEAPSEPRPNTAANGSVAAATAAPTIAQPAAQDSDAKPAQAADTKAEAKPEAKDTGSKASELAK